MSSSPPSSDTTLKSKSRRRSSKSQINNQRPSAPPTSVQGFQQLYSSCCCCFSLLAQQQLGRCKSKRRTRQHRSLPDILLIGASVHHCRLWYIVCNTHTERPTIYHLLLLLLSSCSSMCTSSCPLCSASWPGLATTTEATVVSHTTLQVVVHLLHQRRCICKLRPAFAVVVVERLNRLLPFSLAAAAAADQLGAKWKFNKCTTVVVVVVATFIWKWTLMLEQEQKEKSKCASTKSKRLARSKALPPPPATSGLR